MDYSAIPFIVILIIVLWFFTKQRKAPREDAFGDVSITVYGDSICAGHAGVRRLADALRAAYPELLVVDKAVSGLSLQSLVHGYKAPYEGADPEIYPDGPQPPFNEVETHTSYALLALGGNDALELRSVEDYKHDLLTAIQRLQSQNVVVILSGIVDFRVEGGFFTEGAKAQRDLLDRATKEIADKYHIAYLGWGNFGADIEDTIDPVHKADHVIPQLAATVVKVIINR